MENNKSEINNQEQSLEIIDIGSIINKIISNWYYFIIVAIFFYFLSILYIKYFTVPIYEVNATIEVNNKNSGLFNQESSINFMWGNNATKITSLDELMRSRTHNEILIKENSFFIDYLEINKSSNFFTDDEKILRDVTEVPFRISIDYLSHQTINKYYQIEIIPNSNQFYLSTYDDSNGNIYNYISEKEINSINNLKYFKRTKFSYGSWINSKNFRFRVEKNVFDNNLVKSNTFIWKLKSINSSLSILSGLTVEAGSINSNVVKFKYKVQNKKIGVNFLNNSLKQLVKTQLNQKNIIPNNTIAFIQEELSNVKKSLDKSSENLKNIRERENIIELSGQGNTLLGNINNLESKNYEFNTKLQILKQVQSSINKGDMEGISALSGLEINSDPSLTENIRLLRELSIRKIDLLNIYQPESQPVKELNFKINSLKKQLQSTTSNFLNILETQKRGIERDKSSFYRQVNLIPKKEQSFLYATRDYTLNNELYTKLLEKLSESRLIKVANVSDIDVIDFAKDTGQTPIKPEKTKIYLIFILVGLVLLLILIVLDEIFDFKIKSVDSIIDKLTPKIIGFIPFIDSDFNKTLVLNEPNSNLAESFRLVLSNLRFLQKKSESNFVIALTSSISGEGKTFNAISLASMYAISGKKTILVGVDLRKPKIAEYFNFTLKKGISNYLVDDETDLEKLILNTGNQNFDVLLSGDIPPNPYEIISNQKFVDLINLLKSKYEIVILDTPPLNLVADSFEILKNSDYTLIVIRENYSSKEFVKNINNFKDRFKNHEVAVIYNGVQKKKGYWYGYGYGYGENQEREKSKFQIILEKIIELIKKFK